MKGILGPTHLYFTLYRQSSCQDLTQNMSCSEFLIGRQQILDRNLEIFGYELLFRSPDGTPVSDKDGTTITQQLILDALLELGLEKLTGNARAFINLTADNILQGTAELLPKEKVVIEILENASVTNELVHTTRRLVESGYLVALDDFVFYPEWEPLLQLAHIVKIDVRASSESDITGLMTVLKDYQLEILVEKIETEEEFHRYQKMGGHYYQGFFFDRPQIMPGKRVEAYQHTLLQVLAEIHQPEAEMKQIATLISRDPGLSFKLLNFINSALFCLPNRIETIEQAVVLLGLRELQRWTALLTLSQTVQNQPNEHLCTALIRARMCELLAHKATLPSPSEFFLVGLFSNLDGLLAIPLENILDTLPLANRIIVGLLKHQGPMGEALSCVLHYESWQLQKVHFSSLPLATISQIYVESVVWAHQSLEYLTGHIDNPSR